MMEPTEGEKWAKFPAADAEGEMLHAMNDGTSIAATQAVIGYVLSELIKQRAEISTLKATLNIED